MKAAPVLPIALLCLTLSACQTAQNKQPDAAPSPKLQSELLKDALANIDNKGLQEPRYCPAVYKPVCAVIRHNGQTHYQTFANECHAAGPNIISIGAGACE